ncbi:CASP-like protein 1E2 [Cucurbita moschata]|uniref:CASP-like protein n=1 Tax=Cucurbita moschata TaxID=3662 RepID=A0A6J1FS54_CUCMO|nr:CASP-like protein 1E2 [Cucurbita moschata]
MEVERRSVKKEEEEEEEDMNKNVMLNHMAQMGFRFLGFVLSLVAAIVVGLNKQSKVVPLTVSLNLPPLDYTLTANWHYLSALVYLLATNVIACSYSFLSFVFLLKNKNKDSILALLVIVLDTVMVALLFSSSGAAAAVGVIAYHGNSHVQWNKVCDVYGRFCKQMAASTVLSLAGAVVFMLLVVLASVGLQKRPK